jgi:thymidylate synthase (FAD)
MESQVLQRRIDVLDHGYVLLTDSMGSDLSVVNAARVSYDKASQVFDVKDERLLAFLRRENHTAPFRHAIVSLECYAPLLVKNQWFKHLVGGVHHDDMEFPGIDPFFAWNESSRRYVTEEEQFYIPTEWRSKPENSKQGSGLPLSEATGAMFTADLATHTKKGLSMYKYAMKCGVAPEQARLFLPAYSLYVRWRWTTSLQGAMHFINLREHSTAQEEIRVYASAVKELVGQIFPKSIGE